MGAIIGAVIGSARGMIVIAVLFMIVSLYPGSMFSRYVEASPIYMQGAKSVIEPLSGNLIKDKLPVFTQAVQKELGGILQRKYEVIDHNIPADIESAASEIVKGQTTDEAKARALYDWVGSRIQYDYGKVDDYEQKAYGMNRHHRTRLIHVKGYALITHVCMQSWPVHKVWMLRSLQDLDTTARADMAHMHGMKFI